MTSGPIPSPGTAAILCLRMRFLSCLGSERAQDALGHAFEVGRAGDVARPCRWACQRPIHRLPPRGGRLDGREYTMGAAEPIEHHAGRQIGIASFRVSVCQYFLFSFVSVSL